MNKQEIQQVVESYIKNENARYALLISGVWGCGKTFLYENYLADAISALEVGKNNRKTNIYISLYGMNSIEALSKQLLSNYLIYAKANGNDIVRKGVKAVSGILGAASRAFSFSAGAVSMDLEKLNELSTTIEVKDLVICFDDLERCSISISEVFGYINNLIEHCNCKVIILADEDNIGKTYANINVEQKYQTILTGGRKVIRDKPEDKTKRTDLATDELTMKELKQLNETLYSENYIYRDIKEKVIGKTCKYTPGIEESLKDLIMGNAKSKGYLEEGKYRQFLTEHMDKIVNAFHEAGNNNLRVAAMWIDLFEEIYKVTCKNFNESEYYEEIVADFLRYSIWIVVADRDNKTLISNLSYYGDQKYVHFENHKYTYTAEYFFVNKYMRNASIKFLYDKRNKMATVSDFKRQYVKAIQEGYAGAAHEYGTAWEYTAPQFIRALVKELYQKHYKIITGHARGIGSYVISAIVEECQNNVSKLEKHLMIKAFPYEDKNRNDYKELVTTYREGIFKNAGIAIFMFGNKISEKGVVLTDGVYQEFKIAQKANAYIIPIGSTGYVAKQIWDEVCVHINDYPYLKSEESVLRESTDPAKIICSIMKILSRIQKNF